MMIYVALVAGTAFAFLRLPEGFLPVEDQGFFTVDIQTPPGASFNGRRGPCARSRST